MKYKLVFLLIVVMTACNTECQQYPKPEIIIEPKQIKNGDFVLIGENLFKDKPGNIYFRTIDRSALNDNREVYATYSKRIYYDTFIANERTFVEFELKNVIDVSSFKRMEKKGLITYYKDKNHTYFHREVASGGMLHCYK